MTAHVERYDGETFCDEQYDYSGVDQRGWHRRPSLVMTSDCPRCLAAIRELGLGACRKPAHLLDLRGAIIDARGHHPSADPIQEERRRQALSLADAAERLLLLGSSAGVILDFVLKPKPLVLTSDGQRLSDEEIQRFGDALQAIVDVYA